MLKDEYLVYINENNESAYFGYNYDLIPTNFSDELDNDIVTSKFALQNGSTFNSSSLSDRSISIKAIYSIAKVKSIEEKLKKVFNPTIKGTFYKYTSTDFKKIDVRLESIPKFDRKVGLGSVEIDMIALNPFYEVGTNTEILAKENPMLMFPINFIDDNIFGYRVSQIETVIENKGDVETGFICIFKANGNVKNPSIINNITKEQIRINCELELGDVVQVINLPYNKMVIKNGKKDFSLLDISKSTFFNLLVGKNKLGIDADENLINLESRIEFTALYL